MTDLLKVLNNIRSLRVLAREISLEQLELMLNKLQQVVDEKRIEQENILREENERKERIEKLKQSLEQQQISLDELAEALGHNFNISRPKASKQKRIPRPAKYKYTDFNGEEKTWTGQGRTPKPIQDALDKGKSLADFEI